MDLDDDRATAMRGMGLDATPRRLPGGRWWAAAVLVAVTVVPIPPATATSLEVTRFDDPVEDGCDSGVDCSLREAIIAANANPGPDDIQLQEGTYTLSGHGRALLDVTDPTGELFIVGEGVDQTTITKEAPASGFFRVVAGAELRLHDLSIVGTGDLGELSVGAWNDGGEVHVVDSRLADHKSTRGSGLWNDAGVAFVTRTTIHGGSAGLGGAVYNGDGFVFVSESTLTGAVAVDGGAVYNDTGTTSITAGAIAGNMASAGGGIFNKAGTVTVDGTDITDNTLPGLAVGEGGGIYNAGILSVVGAAVRGHTASVGGGIFNRGLLELGGGTVVTGNSGLAAAGGIYNELTALLDGVAVSSNWSGTEGIDGFGGGIVNLGDMEIAASSISGNEAVGGQGGGIVNADVLTVVGTTIDGNRAGFGGGVLDFDALNLTNSTVSGNSAEGLGGGLWLHDSSQAYVIHATITGNDAVFGGGVFSDTSGALLTATILAANSSTSVGADCSGSLTSAGYNVLGTDDGCVFTPAGSTDQIGSATAPIDPRLGPLAANGGPTATHALLVGSPAKDAVPSVECALADDQRGVDRPQEAGCDTGAFERQPNLAPFADAGADLAAEASAPATAVALDGTGSSDPDGDPLTYVWTGGFSGGSSGGPAPLVHFADVGTYEVTLTVTDGLASDTDTVLVVVADTQPPEPAAALAPAGKVGPNDGTFEVDVSCIDSFDAAPLATAQLNDVAVVDGQIVKLKRARTFSTKTVRGGQLFLLGPEFVLEVTCTDASGNTAGAVAEHVFGS